MPLPATAAPVSFSTNNLQAFMDLFTLMAYGPTHAEQEQDFSRVNTYMHTLVPRLFSSQRYDTREPSHYPVEVQSYLLVNHIELMVSGRAVGKEGF